MAKWYRDTSKDIVNKSTLYTDSTTLTVGATLYNNLGEDSGIKVGTVNPDGSFEIEEVIETVIITLTSYKGAGAWSGSFEGTVNDIAFVSTSNVTTTCEPNTFEVIKGQPCTINAEKTSGGYGMILADSASNQIAYGDLSFEYTFTPTEDCTFEIGANIEK